MKTRATEGKGPPPIELIVLTLTYLYFLPLCFVLMEQPLVALQPRTTNPEGFCTYETAPEPTKVLKAINANDFFFLNLRYL